MALQDWLSTGWLTEHQTSPKEIADLLEIAERDLKDSQTKGLGLDWRFNIAYNAALQAATAALAAAGFRTKKGDGHHYRVIQSLALTIGSDSKMVSNLDAFRKKRNISDYDRVGAISPAEAREMFKSAKRLRDDVIKWLRDNYPYLLPTPPSTALIHHSTEALI